MRRSILCFAVLLIVAAGGAAQAQFVYEVQTGGVIPDDNLGGLTKTINVPDSFTVADVNLFLFLRHADIGDLTVTLEGPLGQTIKVWDTNCVNDDDIIMVFDDEGPGLNCGDQAGFGNYWPANFGLQGSLSLYDGTNAQGDWKIKIVDDLAGDEGDFIRAKLMFQPDVNSGAIASIQGDVTMIKSDVTTIKSDVTMVKNQVATLQLAVDALQATVDLIAVQITQLVADIAMIKQQLVDLQNDVTMIKDTVEMLEMSSIEKALWNKEPIALYSLPQAFGGKLEFVRTIVTNAIAQMQNAGETTYVAATLVSYGDTQYSLGMFKDAYQLYARGYCLAVAPPEQVQGCLE